MDLAIAQPGVTQQTLHALTACCTYLKVEAIADISTASGTHTQSQVLHGLPPNSFSTLNWQPQPKPGPLPGKCGESSSPPSHTKQHGSTHLLAIGKIHHIESTLELSHRITVLFRSQTLPQNNSNSTILRSNNAVTGQAASHHIIPPLLAHQLMS